MEAMKCSYVNRRLAAINALNVNNHTADSEEVLNHWFLNL